MQGSNIRLLSTEFLRSRNAGNTADVNLLHANASDQLEAGGNLYMAGNQVKNAADPTVSTDLATKNYVDNKVLGLNPKASVAAATTGPLPSNTYSSGPMTLTGTGSLGSIDGYTPLLGDRLLIQNEAAPANNGIYSVTTLSPYVLTRTPDANNAAELQGAYVYALNGSTQQDNQFILTVPGATNIVLGTTPLTFENFGQVNATTAGNGLVKAGPVMSVNPGVGLGFLGAVLQAETQGAGTLNTTGIDGSNNIKALHSLKSTFVLASQDILNQYIDLSVVAHTGSIQVTPTYFLTQVEGADYSVNYTGGVGSKTRISFIGDLAQAGAISLQVGDILNISCLTL